MAETDGPQLTRLDAEPPVFSAERTAAGAEDGPGVSADMPAQTKSVATALLLCPDKDLEPSWSWFIS